MAFLPDIRRYWDDDAPTYDDTPHHLPRDPAVLAAWTATLERLLPAPPARILDCGAGTGFLSLLAASLGHRVTALDVSAAMLERLAHKAAERGLSVETALGDAGAPAADATSPFSAGAFDVVMERHLLWTLADPPGALRSWRGAVRPGGHLVLAESVWGRADPAERLRAQARRALHGLRRLPPDHHAEYPLELRRALPLGSGTPPAAVVRLVAGAGWPAPRLVRLGDVEWAERQGLALFDRLLGVPPRYAVVAG